MPGMPRCRWRRWWHVPVPLGLREDVWALLLSLPVIFYSSWIFFDGAWRALRARAVDMMVLVAVAVGAGWLYSMYVTITGGGMFCEAATVLAAFVLLGHWFEMRARGGATDDGVVADGESEVDESMVTGESMPVHKPALRWRRS